MDLNYGLAEVIRSFANINYLDSVLVVFAEYLAYSIPFVLVYLFLKGGRYRADGLFVFFSTVLAIQLSHVVGWSYFHPRPFEMFDTLLTAYPDNSLPSQHASTMFAVAIAFIYRNREGFGLFFAILAVLNSLGRVAVGFHFPLDIIAGLITATIAIAIFTTLEKHTEKLSKKLDKIQETVKARISDRFAN